MSGEAFDMDLLRAKCSVIDELDSVAGLDIRTARTVSCQIILSEPRRLFREALARMLNEAGYQVVASSQTVPVAFGGALQTEQAYVLICGVPVTDSIELLMAHVSQEKSRRPELKIVVLADRVDSRLLCLSAECGVDALLSTDISEDVLRGALSLVLLGQRLFPAPTTRIDGKPFSDSSFGTARSQIIMVADSVAPSADVPVLSEREDQILRFLASGKRNKLIAHDLGISEATVKFHIRALMRKLGVANRTQAAIFSMNRNKAGEAGETNEMSATRAHWQELQSHPSR